MLRIQKPAIVLIIFAALLLPSIGRADYLGQKVNFFIDSSYDLEKREQITATLQKITKNLYFYIDDSWWDGLTSAVKDETYQALDNLSLEFEKRIYPNLTYIFGSEPKPGIDRDERITILIHPMIEKAGGYFNSGDGYPRAQYPKSNQREMFYLNALHLTAKPRFIYGILAHEFMHLITFNQKEILRKVSEEIWLNEARAEFVVTWLGYNDEFEGSNLQRRTKIFLSSPQDSLTEWLNKESDYGVINLFIHYLVDHYGLKILVDSLHSSKVGILSLNEALAKNGFREDFSQIFTDWTIAVLIGDCKIGPRYCYLNPNLKKFRITPSLNFLPTFGQGMLSFTHLTKNWSGNWFKIIGGRGVLKFEFDGADEVNFKVPYLICDKLEKCSVNFLNLDKKQKGVFYISDFNEKYTSLTIIPSVQSKTSGFNGPESLYSFSWTATTLERTPEEEAELREKLLAQIEFLKAEIAKVQAQITTLLTKKGAKLLKELSSCQKFEENLFYGLRNDERVRCLQKFLKAQGPEIYPEGLVTGNFLSLTKTAVIRFQEKYAAEILAPLGLQKGTGYVGSSTRAKINQILGY